MVNHVLRSRWTSPCLSIHRGRLTNPGDSAASPASNAKGHPLRCLGTFLEGLGPSMRLSARHDCRFALWFALHGSRSRCQARIYKAFHPPYLCLAVLIDTFRSFIGLSVISYFLVSSDSHDDLHLARPSTPFLLPPDFLTAFPLLPEADTALRTQ